MAGMAGRDPIRRVTFAHRLFQPAELRLSPVNLQPPSRTLGMTGFIMAALREFRPGM